VLVCCKVFDHPTYFAKSYMSICGRVSERMRPAKSIPQSCKEDGHGTCITAPSGYATSPQVCALCREALPMDTERDDGHDSFRHE
jgi:hypothetical protein